MSDEAPRSGGRIARRIALPLAYAILLGAYATALLYWEPPRVLLKDEPVSGRDLDTHIGQSFRVADALANCADPFLRKYATVEIIG